MSSRYASSDLGYGQSQGTYGQQSMYGQQPYGKRTSLWSLGGKLGKSRKMGKKGGKKAKKMGGKTRKSKKSKKM